MTANHSPTPVVQDAAQSNLELAESLREVATWLEMHAGDLPEMWLGYLHFRNQYERSDRAREELTAFAKTLGDREVREEQTGNAVAITGAFGPLKVRAEADVRDLRAEPLPPAVPEYEPILKPSGGVFTDEELDRAVEPHVDNQGYEVTPWP
jgi:CO/xanthine dehydrogenase Mo-binding subunit